MLTRAGKNCDCVERISRLPNSGEYVVLADYMLGDFYAVYNNPGDGRAPVTYEEEESHMLGAPDLALDEGDGDALLLCMEQARAMGRGKQLDKMLETRTWPRVAFFACYCCQMHSLKLQPHDSPPCHINFLNDADQSDAAKLLRRMLAAGVSKWHPQPLVALGEEDASEAVGGRQ